MLRLYVVLSLVIVCVFGQTAPVPCLYSPSSNKVLTPLVLPSTSCPKNISTCMQYIYNYGNFKYNGPSKLMPNKSEVVMALLQYPDGSYHYMTMLNANVTTVMNVTMSMTGTGPANLELKDDPDDTWQWDPNTNSGHFTWNTLPTYTDGCIIGPITFVDSYCITVIFNQPNNAINLISIMTGDFNNPNRIISIPYVSGSKFQFCQYPQTVSYHTDTSCPNAADGTANVTILNGPSSVVYRWYNGSTLIGSSPNINGLKAGNYTVYVNDTTTNGCKAVRDITVVDPVAMAAPGISTTSFDCTPGQGTATAMPMGGSAPYTFQWMQNSMVIGTGNTIKGLAVGTYSGCATDRCGTMKCTSFSINSVGCCGDGMCQSNEVCGSSSFCSVDCGKCCAPGTYMTGPNSCTVCPAGSYSTTYGATNCTSCPANTYNDGGNNACTSCPDNTQSSPMSGSCMACAPGTIRASGETACHACADGSVPTCGSATCTSCPAGTYAASGSSSCQACGAGYMSAAGSASCTQCSMGTYSSSDRSMCTSCPSGTSSMAGASHMLACDQVAAV